MTSSEAHRFSSITDDSKAGILWIASLIAGVYSVLSVLVRFYIKRKCYGLDDWACAVATLVSLGSFVAIYVALSQGLGKSSTLLHATQLHDISDSVFASRIALIVALSLSKFSTVLLIKRLFSQDMALHQLLCDIVLGCIAIWGFASMIGVSVRCNPGTLLETASIGCSGQLLRWKLIGICDAITEASIVLLSTGLVWRLQMRFDVKLRVILAFVFRLPIIPAAIIHILLIHDIPADNLARTIIPALACEQVELGYSLLSATIPNLKSFIMSFDTAMMMDVSYKLNSMARSSTAGQRSDRNGSSSSKPPRLSDIEARDDFISRLRPASEGIRYTSEIQHSDNWEISNDDLSITDQERVSQDRAIRCDRQWKVEESYA
ncbi:hypothetical protein EJ08DRAFT_295621 [Tothia fuscella]|uniref:Rhodopsin domain-containing protein n=1 Tax=Tothia fuscella TaxID=1048955 RepID=A0A9P4U2M6_9PEZI|nr:hypothetical protein EJ08DRAFT_295621 [Tothia fuscella]